MAGHADFEVQNIPWHGLGVWAMHDWDSLAWQLEAALAGAASGSFASDGPPTLAPIESSEAFLGAYQDIRTRLFTAAEQEVAWAPSLWMAAYNAREEAHAATSRRMPQLLECYDWRTPLVRDRARKILKAPVRLSACPPVRLSACPPVRLSACPQLAYLINMCLACGPQDLVEGYGSQSQATAVVRRLDERSRWQSGPTGARALRSHLWLPVCAGEGAQRDGRRTLLLNLARQRTGMWPSWLRAASSQTSGRSVRMPAEVRWCWRGPTVLFVPIRRTSSDSSGQAARPTPYNPLDKTELARSVEAALLNTDQQPLANVAEFYGAGIYVLYYQGSSPLYRPIIGTPTPIYVGKAVPKGSRKARIDERVVGRELWIRLGDHRESAEQGADLDPKDFLVRYLVADDVFIPLAERLMIRTFTPVWNRVVDGFGNHDPGSGRYNQKVSPWDTLHPGRPWVGKLSQPCKFTVDQMTEMIGDHFEANPPVAIEAKLPPAGPVTPLSEFEVADEGDE